MLNNYAFYEHKLSENCVIETDAVYFCSLFASQNIDFPFFLNNVCTLQSQFNGLCKNALFVHLEKCMCIGENVKIAT